MTVTHTVTLVHGTFTKNPSWIRENSPLRTALTRCLGPDCIVEEFHWSGENTDNARVRAGRELSGSLRSLCNEYPEARHSIIAHSHGGNVVAYALSQIPEKSFKVVCLGVPFITGEARNFLGFFDLFSFPSSFLFGLFFGVAVAYFAQIPNEFILAAVGVSGLSFCFVLPLLSRRILRTLLIGAPLRTAEYISHTFAVIDRPNQFLAVTVGGDEARLALYLVDVIAEFPIKLVSYLITIAELISIAGACLHKFRDYIGIIAFIIFPLYFLPWLFDGILILCIFIPIVIGFICVPIFVLSLFRRVGYWDGFGNILMNQFLVRTYASPRPITTPIDGDEWGLIEWESGLLREKQYARSGTLIGSLYRGALQHSSLYQRPDIIEDICVSIKEIRPAD